MPMNLKDYSSMFKLDSKTKKLKEVRKINSLRKLDDATRIYRPNYLLLIMGLRMTKYYELRSLNRFDIRSLNVRKLKARATTGYLGFKDLKNKFDS